MNCCRGKPRSRRSRRRRVLRDENGSVVEAAIAVPAAMLIVFLAVQAALWAHAESIVQASAAAGVQAASEAGGSVESGSARAGDVITHMGGQVIAQPVVQVRDSAGATVKVHVAGWAESILPWMHLPVSADRTGTRQLFRQSG